MEHDIEESGLWPAVGEEEPELTDVPGADVPEAAGMLNAADAAQADQAAEGGALPAEPRQTTGEPRVDEALRKLDELAELPVSEHPAIFECVHARLTEVLGELDSGSLAGAAGRQGS